MAPVVATDTLRAQEQVPAPVRVVHVWVDPYFGNDALAGGAAALNPNGSASFRWCTPVIPPRPHQVVNSFGQVLLHAPHPFKTITAAVDYIVATNPGAAQPLPAPSAYVYWEHAIIHLMPGVYGAAAAQQTFGQPANGETFPIFLPPNVSVQGTSALNTTLVLGSGNSPAFQFGVNHLYPAAGRTVAINGENTFIDGVSITGTAGVVSNQAPRPQLCGVWVADDVPSQPTITNCILYGLWIGVGVGASQAPGVEHHGLTLANNTFAWNRIGVWNGVDVSPAFATGTETGRSEINILNCLFDGSPWEAGQTCAPPWSSSVWNGSQDFEGVSWEDLRVMIAGVAQDTNAWEVGKHSFGGQIFFDLAPTAPRATTPVTPRVDLSPITGAQGQGAPQAIRGNLYVRDVLCRPEFVAGLANFDRSPHDFRLAPNVALADPSMLLPLGALNPLVDAGFSDAGFSGAGTIVFENGNILTEPPGFLPLGHSQSTWTFSAWEFDLEGYGNPRISDHPVYPNPVFGAAPGDTIDIGADEVGQLIIPGYRSMTTELRLEQTPLTNHRCWYLGPAGTVIAGGALVPLYRTLPALSATAWPSSAYPVPTTWHTPQPRAFTTSVPTAVPPQVGQPLSIIYPATMADVTPHLLPDAHPWWSLAWSIGNPSGIPPALTLWEQCLGPNHNAALYFDPTSGRINPPGAGGPPTVPSFTWLDGRSYFGATTPVGVFPFGVWSQFSQIDGFDAVCRGFDLGTPVVDVVTNPSTVPPMGSTPTTLRFTVELLDSELPFDMPSNLQTFTIWNDGSTPQ